MTRTKVKNSSLSYDSGALSGFRNRITNGAMEISQRGTSFAAVAGGTYTLDRFLWGTTGTGVVTIIQSTDVPNNTFRSSLEVDVTTADASVDVGDSYGVIQRIEGYNVRDLIGQTFTLSFWVKSPKAGIHCVSFRNSTTDRSYVMEYTVSTANTWEYKSVTVTGGLITAGTWDWTNGIGLVIRFSLATGTTFQTTAGAWQVGDFHTTSNQVNCMDNVANDFFLTGVQLELGPIPTPFERRPYGAELALCQRYFQQLGNVIYATIGSGVQQNTTIAAINVPILTQVRTSSPVITISNLIVTDRTSADAVVSSVNETRVSETSVYVSLIHTAFGAAGRACLLASSGATVGYLRVSAEL